MKKISLIVLCLCVQTFLFAQNRVSISGRVECKTIGEGLPMTPVQILELDIFTVMDMSGRFSFERIPVGTYTFRVTCMGFRTMEEKVTVERAISDLLLVLDAQDLALEGVEVVAQRGSGMNSSSVVNRQAIEHVQASSIRDIMQLVPGALTVNTDMTSANLLTIRALPGETGTNALGTALIIDGAAISNDMNMQMLDNGNTSLGNTRVTGSSTAMSGTDVRSISTDNIESIEVIRGIPSVEYGNMTSGAVVVRSRAGQSPLEVRFKTDPKLKQIYAGKGVHLGKNRGIFNLGADYTNAIKNLYSPVDAFNRINVNAAYSNTFAKNLTFNLRVVGDYGLSTSKNDPDNNFGEEMRQESKGLRMNINGAWNVQTPTHIVVDYVLQANVREKNDYFLQSERQSSLPLPSPTETGTYEGYFSPRTFYHSELTIHGFEVD